jgi:hypothetical protein
VLILNKNKNSEYNFLLNPSKTIQLWWLKKEKVQCSVGCILPIPYDMLSSGIAEIRPFLT